MLKLTLSPLSSIGKWRTITPSVLELTEIPKNVAQFKNIIFLWSIAYWISRTAILSMLYWKYCKTIGPCFDCRLIKKIKHLRSLENTYAASNLIVSKLSLWFKSITAHAKIWTHDGIYSTEVIITNCNLSKNNLFKSLIHGIPDSWHSIHICGLYRSTFSSFHKY